MTTFTDFERPYNKRRVPAKPYVSWMDYQMKEMDAIQEAVKVLMASEGPFLALRDALEATSKDYPQIFRIQRSENCITAKCDLLHDQHYSVFKPLAKAVHDNLTERGILEHGEWDSPHTYGYVYWRFRTKEINGKNFYIRVELEVPPTGNLYRKEVRVQKHIQASTYIDINYQWDDFK